MSFGVKCTTCGAVSDGSAVWTYMTRIDPKTGDRGLEWRCPACNQQAACGLGIGARPDALKRARKRGNGASARVQRGTTKGGAR